MDYQKLLNKTVAQMKPSGIRRFFDIANEMENVISLSIGEPDFSTPFHIREKGIESLEKGKTWYTPNAGLFALREAIADALRGTDILVLSDEIYGDLTYGKGRHVSFASLPNMQERTILISGFSKAFAMTGWRLGYVCAPAPLCQMMTKLHQFALMCVPKTAQHAAIEAMRRMREFVNECMEKSV